MRNRTISGKAIRVAVIGNSTYFENHFPEGWRRDPNIGVFDANEGDLSFLVAVANFRPQLSIFFRPELYPAPLVQHIPGNKVALLSEPVPKMQQGQILQSAETRTRLSVYARMSWPSYDAVYYYDESKRQTIERLGWPIDGYQQLPVDTSVFRPHGRRRPIDVCFVGKPTERRVRMLDTFRYTKFKFVWIAYGVSGKDLAHVFRRSKVMLNIHADGISAFEPRVLLGAACGCAVVSEDLGSCPDDLRERIVTFEQYLNWGLIEKAIRLHEAHISSWQRQGPLTNYSMRSFIDRHVCL